MQNFKMFEISNSVYAKFFFSRIGNEECHAVGERDHRGFNKSFNTNGISQFSRQLISYQESLAISWKITKTHWGKLLNFSNPYFFF